MSEGILPFDDLEQEDRLNRKYTYPELMREFFPNVSEEELKNDVCDCKPSPATSVPTPNWDWLKDIPSIETFTTNPPKEQYITWLGNNTAEGIPADVKKAYGLK